VETPLDILDIHLQLFQVILLLRTTAIYYGSKCVIVPLSVVCAVFSKNELVKSCGSPDVQVEVVIGIVVTWYHLHTAHGEYLSGLNGRYARLMLFGQLLQRLAPSGSMNVTSYRGVLRTSSSPTF